MPHRIKRLPQAIADGLEIWLHIAADNMGAADRLADQLDLAIGRLSEYPHLGSRRTGLDQDIRAFPVETIMIFYRVSPGAVEIVRILHSARDITSDMLG